MCVCGEMWRNLSCGEMFPHDRLLHMNQLAFFFAKSVLSQFTLLLSRNLFCSDLRAFVWRKFEPKIVRVEKKRQISGMHQRCIYQCFSSIQLPQNLRQQIDYHCQKPMALVLTLLLIEWYLISHPAIQHFLNTFLDIQLLETMILLTTYLHNLTPRAYCTLLEQ